MDDQRLGSIVRAVRIRRGWRQVDLATKAGVSPSTISRIERGHIDTFSLATLRHVGVALDIRVELVGRWRAGDLDRLLNAKHSALHEQVARLFRDDLPGWVMEPEVSFAIYGERGIIDILAWHPGRRALLVIELKTDVVDVNELVGKLDQKRRLARTIARERGWDPVSVSVWVIVAAGRTNSSADRRPRGDAPGRVSDRWSGDQTMAPRPDYATCSPIDVARSAPGDRKGRSDADSTGTRAAPTSRANVRQGRLR